MSVMVDTPVVGPSNAAPLQRHPSSHSMEIIDVDQLDDIPAPAPTASSSTTTRPVVNQPPRRIVETISLLDSDEDDDVVMLGNSQPQGRERLFSPPPPRASSAANRIPPLPSFPRHLAQYRPIPPRRQTPLVTSPPVVRANAQPFAFELAAGNAATPQAGPSQGHLHPHRHRHIPRRGYDGLAPPAPSHHVPHMGLGGALITANRRAADMRARVQQPIQQAGTGGGGGWIQRIFRYMTGSPEEEDPQIDAQLNHLLDQVDDEYDHPAARFARRELLLQQRRQPPPPDYKPEYTHPVPSEPGFTFNFAPAESGSSDDDGQNKVPPAVIDLVGDDDEDLPMPGPSSQSQPTAKSGPPSPPAKVGTMLVCARCLDPLVLGSGLVGDDAKMRRVWALRCGHMVDGKCLEHIAIPDAERTSAAEDGNAREEEAEMEGNVAVDRKGKGKAMEVSGAGSEGNMAVDNNSIRSRLRSRGSVSMASMESVEMAAPPVTPAPPTIPTKLGKRKRSLKSKNKVQETYEWKCPVQGCGHVHVSVKVNDVWEQEGPGPTISRKGKERKLMVKPEAPGGRLGRGAIACFV